MGFFDKFTDKREKYDYARGSDFLFNLVLMQKDQYTESFDDIGYVDYRSELIGIAASYLEKSHLIRHSNPTGLLASVFSITVPFMPTER